MRLMALLTGACIVTASSAFADTADVLEDLIGYTVLESKTIVGYVDEDGERDDDFEGCDFGRRILFSDGTSLTCATFSYTYSYWPTAVILGKELSASGVKGLLVKMVVDDDIYDMELLARR